MATLDLSAFSYALKTVYSTGKVMSMTYKDNVAFARMPKDTSFPGYNFAFAVRYADMTGRSYSFTKAKANKNPSKGKTFLLTRAHDYALGSIDTETILASEGDEGALLNATKSEADSAINAIARSLGIRTFGNGSGKIGAISNSIAAAATITLVNTSDVVNFEVGQVVVFAQDEASAPRNSGQTLTVNAVNRDTGVLTMSANLNTVTGLAQYDSIFVEGDYASASDRNMVSGFDAWNPKTAPAASPADSFFGVNRSTDITRLSGCRYTSTTNPGLNTEEAISLVANRLGREGWSPDTVYMGFNRYNNLINSLGSKVNYCKESVTINDAKGKSVAEVGFSGVVVQGPKGPMEVFPDMNCPEGTIYVQQLNTWEFKSLGEAPRWLVMGDGGKFRTEENTDSVEFRLAYWGNIRCLAPGANGRYDF